MTDTLLNLYETEKVKAINAILKRMVVSWLGYEERKEVAEGIFHDIIIILDSRYADINDIVRLRQLLYRIIPRKLADWYWVEIDQQAYEKYQLLNNQDYLFIPPSKEREREKNQSRRESKSQWAKQNRKANYDLVRKREKESYQRNRNQKLAYAKLKYLKKKLTLPK